MCDFSEILSDIFEENSIEPPSKEKLKILAKDIKIHFDMEREIESTKTPSCLNSYEKEINKLKEELNTEKEKIVCEKCKGRGYRVFVYGTFQSESDCVNCNGRGRI